MPEPPPNRSSRGRLTFPSLEADWLFSTLLGVAVVLNAGIWAFLGLRYASLPRVLAIHFNTTGQADRVGPREQLFILPIIGLLTLAANGLLASSLYRRDRQLTYLVLGLAVAVQLLLWAAAINLALLLA